MHLTRIDAIAKKCQDGGDLTHENEGHPLPWRQLVRAPGDLVSTADWLLVDHVVTTQPISRDLVRRP